tara:strand:+ start:461 stop:625 length:165 start_codon:yes stop_codon:yes gene_type:complete
LLIIEIDNMEPKQSIMSIGEDGKLYYRGLRYPVIGYSEDVFGTVQIVVEVKRYK